MSKTHMLDITENFSNQKITFFEDVMPIMLLG